MRSSITGKSHLNVRSRRPALELWRRDLESLGDNRVTGKCRKTRKWLRSFACPSLKPEFPLGIP